MVAIGLSAFAVFFTQSSSFLSLFPFVGGHDGLHDARAGNRTIRSQMNPTGELCPEIFTA